MGLTETQKTDVQGDFVAWADALPNQVEPQRVDTYIDIVAPRDLDKNELHELFDNWIDELDSEDP